MTRAEVYVFDIALVALSVNVGFSSLPFQNFQPWINAQSNYLRQFGGAINRILEFDQSTVDNAVWNAQRNLNKFALTNITAQMGAANASQAVENFLTQTTPSHRWMVYAYHQANSAD